MLRFIITIAAVVFFLILSIPLLLMEWIIGRFSLKAQAVSSMKIVQWALRLVIRLAGTSVTFIGDENIPQDRAVLYVGNHRSIFDIIITYTHCTKPTAYVAKIELTKVPIFSIWGKLMLCLFLDRHDLRQGMKTIQKGIDLVKEGTSVCIYPEGTRNRNEDETELLEFHEASFRIANKGGCPVIPIAACNTAEIFEAHFPKLKKTHVVIEYGTPIYPDQLTRDEQRHLGVLTRERIHDMLVKNRELI